MNITKISSKLLKQLVKILPADRVKTKESLSLHTYIKLGGPADVFVTVKTADELAAAAAAAEKLGVPWFILGGGSNILVGDLGFSGLVIKNEAQKIKVNGKLLTAESGALMSSLAAFANEKGLAGLEVFMSVPGTVGGAIFNNSHYRPLKNEFIGNLVEKAEIMLGGSGDVLSRVARLGISLNGRPIRKSDEALESAATDGQFPRKKSPSPLPNYKIDWIKRKIVDKKWFKFGYDYSRLQDEKAVVLKVKFKLKKGNSQKLKAKSLALMKQRNQHQPIGRPSCGCMFKNPDGISAGKLIDEAGMKGVKVGGMSVSKTHANFMVNDGTGKAADVLELMARVKNRVKKINGIELMPEIFFVGEFSHESMKT